MAEIMNEEGLALATAEIGFPIMRTTELKLEYLRRLTDIRGMTVGKEVVERIFKVCDSIEDDLGIKKPITVANITANINVDTIEFGNKLKEVGEAVAQASERIGNALTDADKRLGKL